MALRKTFTRRQTPPPRGYVPPLPHSSWRLSAASTDGSATVRLTSASDFWERLGL